MKLATALSERSDLQKRLCQLESRLRNNARVQEGETPAEDPMQLLEELDSIVTNLENLVTKINLTNARTIIGGETLTAMLSHRDALQQKNNTMRSFLNEAGNLVSRATRSEIKIKSTVPVSQLQKQVDDLSKEIRLLDEKIQESNWTTDLIEN